MFDETPIEAFEAGYNAYWAGDVPDEWESAEAWHNPYVAGWLIASHQDLGMGFYSED